MATYNELRAQYGLSDPKTGSSGGGEYDKLREEYGLNGQSGKAKSYNDLRAQYGLIKIDDNPEEYINSYFRNIAQFYNSGIDRFNSVGFGDASGAYKTFRDTASQYRIQENNIRYYLKNHEADIDPDAYSAIISDLDSYGGNIQSLQDSFRSVQDYYGQWGSQEEYTKWEEEYTKWQEDSKNYELYQQNKKRLQELREERDRLGIAVSTSGNPFLDTYDLSNFVGGRSPQNQDLIRQQKQQKLDVLDGDIARLQAAVDRYEQGIWNGDGHTGEAKTYFDPIPASDGLTAEEREQKIAEIDRKISQLNTRNNVLSRSIGVGSVSARTAENNKKIEGLRAQRDALVLAGAQTGQESIELQLEIAQRERAAARRAVNSSIQQQRFSSERVGTPEAISETQKAMSDFRAANADVQKIKDTKDWLDYVDKYTGKKYDDNFFGQTAANYAIGRMSQDSSLAWNAYLDDPSEENRRMAETADELIERFSMVNSETLADDGTLSWISKDLANYMPQLWDQLKYKAAGTLAGAAVTLGNPLGAKAGYMAGSALYGYQTMRGAAFRELLKAGMDEQTARAAANDEAVISSLIEAGDAILDLVTLGGGKVIDIITDGGVAAVKKLATTAMGKNVVTRALAALGKYALNAGGEYIEESTQEAVSIANQERQEAGIMNLLGGMLETYALMFTDAESDEEQAKQEQMREAGMGGLRLGLMLGGGEMVGNATLGRAVGNFRAEMAVGELRPKLQELTAKTLELNPNDKNALRVQAKMEQGKNVSGMEIYKMLVANEDAAAKKDADIVREAAAARLAELGETGDIEAIADVIARQAAGEKMRRKDIAVIQGSKYGQQIVSELDLWGVKGNDHSYDNKTEGAQWRDNVNTLRQQNKEYARDLSGNIVSPDVQKITNRLIRDGADSQEASETAKRLAEAGKIYGKHADVFTRTYLKGQSVEQYRLAFANIYQAGKDGVSRELIKDYGAGLTDAQKEIAYLAGQKEAEDNNAAKVIHEADLLDVNAEGKTIRTDTNEDIEPDGFDTVGENATIRTKDGQTVSIRNVAFARFEDATLYKTIAKVSSSANIANTLLKQALGQDGMSAIDFAAGLMEAYEAGQIGEKTALELKDAEFAGKLTTGQREAVYNRGKRSAYQKAYQRQQNVKKNSGGKKEGKLHFDRKGRKFDSVRESSLAVMDTLSKALGVDIYVYESYVNEQGSRVYLSDRGEKKAPNGYYDPSDGSIHIDLNAGQSGEGTMLFTVAHELTHFIKDWSSVKYRALADALVKQYQKRGVSVSELVDNQIEKAKLNGREISRQEAFDEVVADSMESMLSDENAAAFLERLSQRDKGLKEKIVSWLKDLAAKLKNALTAYKDVKPDSPEGKMVAEMEDFRKAIMGIYTSALVDAGENFRENGININGDGAKYSIREIIGGSGKNYGKGVYLDSIILDKLSDAERINAVKGFIRKIGGSSFTAYDKNGIARDIIIAESRSRFKNAKGKSVQVNNHMTSFLNNPVKQEALVLVDEMITTSVFDGKEKANHAHGWLDNNGMNEWDVWKVYLQEKNKTVWEAILRVANTTNGEKILYEVYPINMVEAARKPDTSTTNGTVSQPSSVVKQKFTLSDRVEQTKNLVAVHNLTEDKLLSTLKLGGFPMPSIAVTKSDIPHTNFGEISLVFGRETIDPKANRKNTVYSADAWTPTFPKVEYEANSKVTSRVYERLGDLAGSVDQYFKRDLDRARYGVEDLLNRYGGEEELIKAVMDNYGLKAAYLEEQGIHIEPTTKQEIVSTPISAETEDKYLAIMEVLNVTSPDEVGALVLKDVRDQHGAQLEAIYPGITKSALRLGRVLNRIQGYLLGVGNGTEYKTVTDPTATKDAVDAAIDPDKYEAWVRDLYQGVEASKGLYNGKDPYTPSGNLRSFKQTHIPFTLENIVKSMAAQNGGNTKNVSGFNGVKSLRAATAERFKSIEAMHNLEGRLQNITQEQLDQITDSLQDRLYEIIRKIDVENGEKGSSNSLIRYDEIGNTIMEIGEGRNYNVSDIQRVFKEAGKEVSDDTALELKQLLFDVSQMPVNLFEAKPERVVSFSEVKAAIVPDDASERVISGLKENGIEVLTYKNGDAEDRLLKVNSLENVKFSDRDPTAEATRAALEKENGKLREDVSRLREMLSLQGKVTGGTVPKQSSVEAAAKWLNKYAGAKADVKDLSRMLTDFYRFLATEKDYSWEDVQQRAMVIARYLQDNVQIKPQISDYARDVLREVRGRKITLNESQMAEVERMYGSYEAFRKAAFGTITFVKEGGIPLDTMWNEWATLFPGTFDSEITASDQPQALMDAIDALRNSDTTVMEYAYNRESIAQDLAVAVYDSYWRVDALVTVADRDQRKINDLTARREELKGTIRDKNAQINKLRAEHRAEMDRLKNERNETVAALKQKRQDDMKKLRTDYKKKLEDTRQHYQEAREKAVDSRNRAQMRKRIQKTVNDLNHLLLDGDKKRHVPESMRKAVAEILSAVNMETSTEEARSAAFDRTVARYNQRIKLENDPAERARLEAARDAYIGKGDQFKAKIDALAKAYEDIKESADPGLQDAYSDAVSQYLFTLEARVGDTRLGDMTLDQLKTVQEVLRIVLSTIRNANRSFLNERAGTIEQQAKRCIFEVSSVWRKKKEGESDVGRWLRGFHYRNLKPIYLMRAIGSNALTEAYNNLRRGEDTWYRDIQGGREFFLSQSGKHGYGKWDLEKTTTFTDDSGGQVKLTLGQIMSLYAYSKQGDDTAEHLRLGGVVLEGESVKVNKLGIKIKYHLNDATPHQLGPKTLAEIIGTLTKEQRAFADEMQDYLSTVMADKGNEVSLAMYGIKLFTKNDYFPIKSAKQYVNQKNEPVGEVKLKNSGFTNKRKPESNNPIILRDFMDVWADHVNEMSNYHAFVLAIEDFNRIINYQTARKEEIAPLSLEQTIQSYMGQEAVSAVRELIQSVNGGARVDPAATFVSKAINLFKKNAVFASASVVIQQPSAIVRAAALIDPKYFVGKIIDREKVDPTWEIIKKYAPVAGIKDMGYFDTNMGKSTVDYIKGPEHDGIKDVLAGIIKREDGSFDELLSMAPGYADKVTWCAIWEAVKRETAGKYPKLATRSEEFLKICGDRFTEVITQTQVYDSVFARSGNMRSKDKLMGMVTSFMAEPTTSINMIYDAVLQGTRGNKAYMKRAIGAVFGAAVLNAVLKSIVYAERDEDDDETYGEKYVSALVAALKDDVLFLVPNSIPFVRDIMSIVQGYSVERMDMELADDLISAVKKLYSDKATGGEKILGILGSFGNLLFPAKNMIREVTALVNVVDTFRNSESQTAMGIRNAIREGWSGKSVSNARQLYEARMAGDTAHEERVAARYENEKSANSAVVSAIREAFMDGDLSEAEAQKHLILYGDTDAGNAYWKVKEWIYAKDKGTTDGYGKYNDLYDAILNGGDIQAAVEEFTENGYDEDEVMSNVKTQVGRWFWDEESETRISAEQASDILEKYFGMKKGEIQETILKWSMKKETGISFDGLREAYLEQIVSESDALRYLQEYGGMTEYDARERVDDWSFEQEHGYAYDDIKSTYLDDEITRAEAISVMTEIGGKSREDAEKKVAYWDYEEKTGVDYENKAQQYKRGIITRQQLRQALIDLGEKSGEDADIQIEAYDWEQDGLQGASFTRVKNWHEYCEGAGVSKQMWLKIALFSAQTENDIGSNGKPIRYSAMKKVMAEIDKLPISKDQKTAIARAIGWSEKNIAKYKPW